MIRVGLLDKNELFRESLHSLIDYKTEMEVHFSSNCFDKIQNCFKPGMLDVVLVDIVGINEREKTILKEVIHHFPETKFVVLSDSISNNLVREFIAYRIAGFYSKSLNVTDLQKGISEVFHSASNFEVKFGSHLQESLLNREFFGNESQNDLTAFTVRELEILNCVCQELTNAEIAEKFGLSVRTIESHRRRMIERTESKTIIGVIMFAVDRSIELPRKEISILQRITY